MATEIKIARTAPHNESILLGILRAGCMTSFQNTENQTNYRNRGQALCEDAGVIEHAIAEIFVGSEPLSRFGGPQLQA